MSLMYKLLLVAVVGAVVVSATGMAKKNGKDEEISAGSSDQEISSADGYLKKEPTKLERLSADDEGSKEVGLNKQSTSIEKKDDLFGLRGLGQWIKYIFSPFELLRKIGQHFKLDHKKLLERIDERLVKGPEVIFEPLVVSFKIMERLFQNDICRRRFFCQIGDHFKAMREPFEPYLVKFHKIPTIGNQIREINQSIFEKNCERDFPDCTPFLKKPFQNLKEGGSS